MRTLLLLTIALCCLNLVGFGQQLRVPLLLAGAYPEPLTTSRIPTNAEVMPEEGATLFSRAYLGLGIGLDYGGIGLKAEFLPSKYVGLFGGVGFALIDPAYNAGLSFKVLPDKKVQPVLIAMYGYNAVIYFKGRRDISKIYYGATAGAGVEVKYGTRANKVSFAILAPARSKAFRNRYDELKEAGVDFDPDILPVAFSIGLNFALRANQK